MSTFMCAFRDQWGHPQVVVGLSREAAEALQATEQEVTAIEVLTAGAR